MSSAPILVVEHEAQCPPAWLGEWLVEAGADLDVRRPYVGDDLPGDLRGHSGMVVLGGEMGADDDADYPWLAEVKALVTRPDNPPVLGVCLGHQLLAVALGGRVAPNPLGQQLGVLDVGWTAAASSDALFAPTVAGSVTVPAVQWNNDVVTRIPEGATVLAHTVQDEVQALRYGDRVWGVQWHPEVGVHILGAWADHDRDAAVERGVDVDFHLGRVAAAEPRLREVWRSFSRRFAELCREHDDVLTGATTP